MSDSCELHELSNCGVCNGADARFRATLQEPRFDPGVRRTDLPRVTIEARFSGRCASCREFYAAGTLIHHSKAFDGWVSLDCCGHLVA